MLIDVTILKEQVAIIKMTRNEKRNALSIDLMKEFLKALLEIEKNEAIRVIVFEGEGTCFCSGLDLTEAIEHEQIEESADLIRQLLLAVYTSSKITIASVHGAAIAGGAGLMTVCDVAVATKKSKIGLPELKRGLVPAFIMVFLKRKLAEGILKELILMARVLTAEEAKQIGWVHYLIDDNERDSFILSLIDEALRSSPNAAAHSKDLLEVLHQRKIEEELKIAEKVHRLSRDSSDAKEGIAAFFDNRDPQWNG